MANMSQETDFNKVSLYPEGTLTIPKLDIAYGFSKDSLYARRLVHRRELCGSLPSLSATGVFFLVECKSCCNSIEMAEIQVSRGAAAAKENHTHLQSE